MRKYILYVWCLYVFIIRYFEKGGECFRLVIGSIFECKHAILDWYYVL